MLGDEVGAALGTSLSEPGDFSKAVEAISNKFESNQRHINSLAELVEQQGLFINEPGADIDAISSIFEDEDKEIVKIIARISWLDRHTMHGSQRRKHGEAVVGVLKSRRDEACLQKNTLLLKRTKASATKPKTQTSRMTRK